MADFSTVDPWTQVLNRLWFLLEENADFIAVVPAGNRIKFTDIGNQNPIKTSIQNGDTPEVCIMPEQSSERMAFTSRQSGSEQMFQLQITTLDMRLTKTDKTGINDLRWLIWKILSTAGDNLGLDFVYKARITTALEHYMDPVNRGTSGWVCFFTIAVSLELPKEYIA
jgi:hypothetical protein